MVYRFLAFSLKYFFLASFSAPWCHLSDGCHVSDGCHLTHDYYLSAVVVAVRLRSAQNPDTAHNNSSSAKSTLQPASLSRPAAAGSAMRVSQIRAVLCRVVLSNPRSVTRHIYRISAGAIFCCSSYTCEVQAAVLLLLLYGLKSPRLCCLPWQQCGSRRLLREGSSTYAHYACLSST